MKIFITKVIFFISIFLTLLPIYEKYDYIFEVLQYKKLGSIGLDLMFNKVSKIKNEDIIYFGDSLNLNIVDLSNFGSSPIIFNEYVKYLISNDIRPKLIIVPLNLRIFSPLDKNVDILWRIPLINELRGYPIPFDVYNLKSNFSKIYDLAMIETLSHGKVNIDKWNKSNISGLKKSYIERYFQTIKNDNKTFQSFVRMTELLIKNKIDFIYYLTPINGNINLVLEDDFFLKRITLNKNKIKSVLNDEFRKNFMDFPRNRTRFVGF